jgi:hypothetical protein
VAPVAHSALVAVIDPRPRRREKCGDEMHQIAAGTSGPVGLAGSFATEEPPLSTETIGRGPSIFEAPTPLQAVPTPQEEPVEELFDGPVESPVPMAELLPTRVPTGGERRRVVVRLVGAEEVELGVFDERDAALACARDAVSRFNAAETAGEWPELDGRHLRPASILSVDVQVAA